MEYRVNAAQLRQTLEVWDRVLTGKEKIALIACGGTALSLLGYKDSTKDVDFTVPNEADYERLRKFLLQAGYQPVTKFGWRRPDELTIYDLYPGQQVYETHLIASPLAHGGHRTLWEFQHLYIGVLNSLDLITTKLFRGDELDMDDCLALIRHEDIDLEALKQRYVETAKYALNEERVMTNFRIFMHRVDEERRAT